MQWWESTAHIYTNMLMDHLSFKLFVIKSCTMNTVDSLQIFIERGSHFILNTTEWSQQVRYQNFFFWDPERQVVHSRSLRAWLPNPPGPGKQTSAHQHFELNSWSHSLWTQMAYFSVFCCCKSSWEWVWRCLLPWWGGLDQVLQGGKVFRAKGASLLERFMPRGLGQHCHPAWASVAPTKGGSRVQRQQNLWRADLASCPGSVTASDLQRFCGVPAQMLATHLQTRVSCEFQAGCCWSIRAGKSTFAGANPSLDPKEVRT